MTTFPALLGSAVLVNWMDVPDGFESDFNNWYTFEHLPERVGVAGFLRGRRFVAVDGDDLPGKWFTVYETEKLSTLASQAYLDRLNNPTSWTTKVVQTLTYLSRTACAVTASVGHGTGSRVVTIEFSPRADSERDVRQWLANDGLPKLLTERHVVAAHLFEADDEVTRAKESTSEGGSTETPGQQTKWLVFAELSGDQRVKDVESLLCGADGLVAHGATPKMTFRAFDTVVELLSL